MEEEDDDFYGGGGGAQQNGQDIKEEEDPEPMEVGDEQDDDEEEESDDEVQFTLEKPEGAKTETPAPSKPTQPQSKSHDRSSSSDVKNVKAGTLIKQEQRAGSTAPTAAVKTTLTHNGKEGKDFPEVRTSTVDMDSTPVWPVNGKPITEVDLDADLAEHSKPWRLPGTDQTDFFNYGFDEYTWAQYCLRQQTMSNTISEQKDADAQMKAMFGGGGESGQGGNAGGMPPGMPPMPNMPGMPSPEEMMQQMMNSGVNPANMDMNSFMQMMSGGGMPGGQGQQGGGGGGFNQQGGNFGQNSVSPHPQGGGQGPFQPPQGPGNQNQQGDQGGYGGNMDGYSPQQMAIMNQQHGSGQGGRRGRGRGRGYY